MKALNELKKKVKSKPKQTGGINSASTGQPINPLIPPENAATQDLSLSKLSISKVTVADFVEMLPEPPQDLFFEFLDAIELESSAPQRERAAIIESGNSRINRIKLVASGYAASVKMGEPHEGLLQILHEEGIDPENIDRSLRSDEVHLKNLQAQYEEENKGDGITMEWFEQVLKAASDYHKYHIGDTITLQRFASYYKELSKAAKNGK